MNSLVGKNILVTGSCGTVGSELINQLLSDTNFNPAKIVGIDNNESELFFQIEKYRNDVRASFFICDIRDQQCLEGHMQNIDVVFHCAALKHVILNEYSPSQTVSTNINGTQNVINAAKKESVKIVVFTSSDKAVNPTNVMGTSKLMGERLMTAANNQQAAGDTVFTSTRFGNVLGSNGSVVQIFRNQIKKGGPLTITEEDMTRFVMSVDQAVGLVINSTLMAKGGEVFITKMPVIQIVDLAKAMIKELAPQYGYKEKDIEIKVIGAKPGEKLYEELMSEEETRRSVELEEFFAVLPAFRNIYCETEYNYPKVVSNSVSDSYVSSKQRFLSIDEIVDLLRVNELI